MTFQGILTGFGTDQPVAGATVELLNNDTGAGTGTTTISGENGEVSLELETGMKVGFKATLANYKETYQFNISAEAQDETVWIVPESIYNMSLGLAGLQVQAGKGTVAGAVYFVNASNEEEPVGCATVESDPETEDIRYFGDNDLPTTLEKQAETYPGNGYFLVSNLDEGQTTVKALVGAEEVGTVDIFTMKDSICISNIYVTTDTNPGCTE